MIPCSTAYGPAECELYELRQQVLPEGYCPLEHVLSAFTPFHVCFLDLAALVTDTSRTGEHYGTDLGT
jgi:hypothetical protein